MPEKPSFDHLAFSPLKMQTTSVLLLTVASLAAVLGAQPEEVKTDSAAARFHYPHFGWQPLIQDRYVCDLDASVLLVVDSNRHHHHRNPFFGGANRAVRVKCSEVANNDEDSCNFCCQQTARRDTTLANDKLFGFLAITKIEDDQTFTRSKRDVDDDDDEDREDRRRHRNRGGFHRADSTYVAQGRWTPDDYDTNVKCVCCAPRTKVPVAQNPTTGYNTVAASPSAYNNAAASAPSTGYSANTFTQPQPIAASQPLVDSWQSDAATSSTWGAAASDVPAAAAPAVTPTPIAANSY